MSLYLVLARFAAGCFLANGVPHFVHGISGKRFQSPFASPPGVGKSSPMVNMLWGSGNLIVGYLLLHGVGDFEAGISLDMLSVALGALLTAAVLAWHFDRVRNR